jgi:hypothetical protein
VRTAELFLDADMRGLRRHGLSTAARILLATLEGAGEPLAQTAIAMELTHAAQPAIDAYLAEVTTLHASVFAELDAEERESLVMLLAKVAAGIERLDVDAVVADRPPPATATLNPSPGQAQVSGAWSAPSPPLPSSRGPFRGSGTPPGTHLTSSFETS